MKRLSKTMAAEVMDAMKHISMSIILRHIGLLEADEDKIRKIRPKGTQVRMLYVPRDV